MTQYLITICDMAIPYSSYETKRIQDYEDDKDTTLTDSINHYRKFVFSDKNDDTHILCKNLEDVSNEIGNWICNTDFPIKGYRETCSCRIDECQSCIDSQRGDTMIRNYCRCDMKPCECWHRKCHILQCQCKHLDTPLHTFYTPEILKDILQDTDYKKNSLFTFAMNDEKLKQTRNIKIYVKSI